MKKIYQTPEMTKIMLEKEDILTLSFQEKGNAGILDFNNNEHWG